MNLVGFLMQYNEASKGNLHRCLENLSTYCNHIVVYDDGSTDNSLEIIREYTDFVIAGKSNDFLQETAHRQQLLELALGLDPDYIFWLDADETLDANGTYGGLRRLCDGKHSYLFEEVTLWRSPAWRRMDYLGQGRFLRLWNVKDIQSIPRATGLHRQLYPSGLQHVAGAPYRVLHYGYATREAIEARWRERSRLGVPVEQRRQGLQEQNMKLEPVPQEWFPKPRPTQYALDIRKDAGLSQ